MNKKNIFLAILVGEIFLNGIFFLYRLGNEVFIAYDEGIYSNVIQGTIDSDNVFLLKSVNTPYFEKPPLYFWEAILSSKVFHKPEFGYRLPSALAGIISVLLIVVIIYALTSDLAFSIIGGTLLLSMAPFVEAARQVRLDVPVTAAILLAIYCFLKGKQKPIWYIGVGIGIALAIFTKSLIGLLVGPIVLVWSLVYKDWSWLKNKYIWIGGVLGIITLLPWHIYESIHYGSIFWQGYSNLNHINSDNLGGSVSTFDYFTFVFRWASPWSELFLLSSIWIIAKWKSIPKEIKFSFLSTIIIFILFSIARTKIVYYLVPLYPFIALTIIFVIKEFISKFSLKISVSVISLLIIGALINTYYFAFHKYHFWDNNMLIKKEEYVAGLLLKKENIPVYTYQYDYWDALRYYGGGKTITPMQDDQLLDGPFFLVAPTPFMQWHSFDDQIMKHMEVEYKGEAVALYKFIP